MNPQSSEANPALILGMGANGLGVARALGKYGIPVICYDADPKSPGLRSKYVNSRILPHPGSSWEEILNALEEEAKGWSKKCVVIPTTDDYLEMICGHWGSLQDLFIMPLAGPSVIERIVDKRSQYELAMAKGIPIPKTLFPRGLEELRSKAIGLRYPLIVKPHQSNSWQKSKKIKGFMAQDYSEILDKSELLNDSDIVILQEYIPGPNDGIVSVAGCIFKNGKISPMVVWRKERQFPTDIGVGSFVRTIEDREAMGLAEHVARSLGYVGVFEVELKRDSRDGQYKLIEMNARSWLQNALADRAGLNLIMVSYQDMIGVEIEPKEVPQSGIRWWDAYSDILAFYHLKRDGSLTNRNWIKSIMGCESFAFLSLDDPMPALEKWRWGANLPLVVMQALKARKKSYWSPTNSRANDR